MHRLRTRDMIWEAGYFPVVRDMLYTFFDNGFFSRVLDAWSMRCDWDVMRTVAHQCNTSNTYNYMGTQYELPRLGLYINIILMYRILQAVSIKTIAVGHRPRTRAHRPTADRRLIRKVSATPYAQLLYRATVWTPRRPTKHIWSIMSLWNIYMQGGSGMKLV